MEALTPPPYSKVLQQLLAAEQAAGPAADAETLRRLRALTSTVLASVKGLALDGSQRRELLAGAYALWVSAPPRQLPWVGSSWRAPLPPDCQPDSGGAARCCRGCCVQNSALDLKNGAGATAQRVATSKQCAR